MTTYSDQVLATPDLVHYWKLDEPGGVPYLDSFGSMNLGGAGDIPNQASLIPSEPSGKCITQTGFAVHGGLIATGNYTWTSDITIAAWIKPSAAWSNIGIAGAWNGNVSLGSMLSTPVGGTTRLMLYTGGSGIDSGHDVPNGTVCFVVGTFDGTNRRIYVDGALAAGPSAGSAPGTPGSPFEIGNYAASGNSGFNGFIDGVAVWSRALSANEVLGLYNAAQDPPVIVSGNSLAVGLIG